MNIDEAVQIIFQSRNRQLTGKSSILDRTLSGPIRSLDEAGTHYDDDRYGRRQTEVGEVLEALETYDSNPSTKNTISLLLEVGDVYVQKLRIQRTFPPSKQREQVLTVFKQVCEQIDDELRKRELNPTHVHVLAEIKYGSRASRNMRREHPFKDKELEYTLCEEAYQALSE